MYKHILAFLLILMSSFGATAQLKDDQTRLDNGEDVNVLYKNESTFGAYIHTAGGIGLAYRRGQHVNANRKRMLEVEIQNFKHPKEVKSVNPVYDNAKGFVYGKLNSFLIIRPGVGFQNALYQKSDKKSVEIRFSYFVGLDLTFAKPTYLEVIYRRGTLETPTIATERYVPGTYNDTISNIYGKASFFRGMDKTTIHPGLYGKIAFSFEYADRYNKIKAIETGAVVDAYPWKLPMMAHTKNQQVYIQLYLKIIWGKKWF
jgi:hypothetical protein